MTISSFNPLVNCHTHLELGWMADICPPPEGRSFTEWIGGLILRRRQAREAGDEDSLTRRAIEDGIQTLLDAGTTHIGDITQTGLTIKPLLDSGLAGVAYIEVIGLDIADSTTSFERARRLLEKHRPHERNGLRIGLSPHAPYSTHPDAFRLVADYCLREEAPMCIHIAESPYENEALVDGTGPFIDLTTRVNIEPMAPPGKTAVHYLESLGVLEARPLLVHAIHLSDNELDIIARTGCKIAHCPRSNTLLQCGRMPLEKMLAGGIPVALGTDSLGSSPSLDVRQEAEAAVALHAGHVPPDAIHALLHNTNVFS